MEDEQAIAEQIKELEVGDQVKATNDRLDGYIEGEVTEKMDDEEGNSYEAVLKLDDGSKAELVAHWPSIPRESEDNYTAYTGLIEDPFEDPTPAVTGLEVL